MIADFYDVTLDQIRDFVDSELTNAQIIRVLEYFEDRYHAITTHTIVDEDGFGDIELDPMELSDLNQEIVDALEEELTNE